MNPDDLKQAWQMQASQTRLTIDTDLLLETVRRDQQLFNSRIYWRDLREAGIAFFMVPLWLYLGIMLRLPWTWYLMVPVLLWITGTMFVDLRRHRRQSLEPGEPLRLRVASLLAQVEHQIWLLRNIFWWYLLPISLAILAFLAQISWELRAGGWSTVLAFGVLVLLAVIVHAGVYWLNQAAIRTYLEPQRQELKTLLTSLQDETPPASTSTPDS